MMSGFRLAHRYEETESGVQRLVESGSFDTEANDNPEWVADAWAEADDANAVEDKPSVAPREAKVQPLPYTEQIDARPFGGEPDKPVEDQEQSPEVQGSVARAVAQDDETEDDEPEDDEVEDDEVEVPVPPKGGAGSGVGEWARYAQSKNVELTKGMTRDEIVAACEAAGVPTE